MYNFVVDSTFDGRRFERGGYQFFGVNKHDVYEITEPNTNLKKNPFLKCTQTLFDPIGTFSWRKQNNGSLLDIRPSSSTLSKRNSTRFMKKSKAVVLA